MLIPTSIRHPRFGAVLFPIPGIEKAGDLHTSDGISFSVNGSTTSIAGLRDSIGSYRARVWFTNLRTSGNEAWSPNADILRIEIVRTGTPPPGASHPSNPDGTETADASRIELAK